LTGKYFSYNFVFQCIRCTCQCIKCPFQCT